MMDCDTTGIEPDIALIKYKKLVGEGFLKIVNQTVPAALRKLGYGAEEVDEILAYLMEHETIEGAPHLKPQHLPVFDCAFKPANGERSIHYMGHVRMMGAIQPFLSGAISKTVNMPEAATAEEIERVYMEGWKLGLKAIAIYRDNSKRSQPLSTGKKTGDAGADSVDSEEVEKLRKQLAKAQVEAGLPHRRRLPAERSAVTHKFDIAGHEGYITVGLYPDGQPGEIFLKMAKEGSTVSGLMDTFATTVSRGAPVRRAAQGPRQQVRPRPVRAVGLHRQPGDPDRQVDRGLHLPLARLALPVARRQGQPRSHRSHRGRGGCPGVLPGLRHEPLRRGGRLGHSSSPRADAGVPPVGVGRTPETANTEAPPSATAVAAEPEASAKPASEPLAVIATNGSLGNGHARQRQRQGRRTGTAAAPRHHPQPRRHQGQLPDPGRRPQLRRLRLDHGPQRQSCYKCLNCGSTSGCS